MILAISASLILLIINNLLFSLQPYTPLRVSSNIRVLVSEYNLKKQTNGERGLEVQSNNSIPEPKFLKSELGKAGYDAGAKPSFLNLSLELKLSKSASKKISEARVQSTLRSANSESNSKKVTSVIPALSVPMKDFVDCWNVSTYLVGRFQPKFTEFTPKELAFMFPSLQEGGVFTPSSCTQQQKAAILIPYRDRWKHLHTLLPVLIPLLMRQNVAFRIFIIEQELPGEFNKGALFNAGYLEALKVEDFDCFIFHDVDMVPVNDRNPYRCDSQNPVHLAAYVDKFKYEPFYDGLFGGVVGFTKYQFEQVNGASNMYFGWGAEDDDLRDRVFKKNFTIIRRSEGFYNMIKHSHGKSQWTPSLERFKVYSKRYERQDVDGLNSIVYHQRDLNIFPLYTWIKIWINTTELLETVPSYLRAGSMADFKYLRLSTKTKRKT
ncbi:beta-N-acetyl-D-glucosaminide beta-1,4-N-acetylglucosaminyl-transferase [Biomphalaria glabrata]|nr:beta-N-acetyl-D-glucosaminide beta-1,4-N-acetylglucosaminyl-transferase [Biomphalaria glabrata]